MVRSIPFHQDIKQVAKSKAANYQQEASVKKVIH